MFSSRIHFPRTSIALFLLAATLVAGCKSKQDAAVEQAEKQAAATGQPQQVVSVDKNGTTLTTVVQPPAPGQKAQSITTTTTPLPPNASLPPVSEPTVSAVPQVPSEPPAPVDTSVTIPAGTSLAIRIDQHISVKTSHTGDRFSGEVVEPVHVADKGVIVPKGALVRGIIDASQKRGHFKGSSLLELRLTSLTLNGRQYEIRTRDLTESKKGKGKRSTAMIAGGTGLGMLVGGLAGGGKGMLIGGAAGGGAGTAAAGMTGNRDLDIPAESIVHFKLSEDLTIQSSN